MTWKWKSNVTGVVFSVQCREDKNGWAVWINPAPRRGVKTEDAKRYTEYMSKKKCVAYAEATWPANLPQTSA